MDVCCPVATWQSMQVPLAEFDEWRRQLLSERPVPTMVQACRSGDEQTVIAVEMIFRAIAAAGWQDRSFAGWGVVAAPQFLGRTRARGVFERFERKSVRGVSPLHIPHLSQHSVAATISVALECHGPCIGAGGSRESLRDAFLAASSLLHGGGVPGVWLALTQWLPEPTNDLSCSPKCLGVALALLPDRAEETELGLRIGCRPTPAPEGGSPGLLSLLEFLEDGWVGARDWRLSLARGLELRIQRRRRQVLPDRRQAA